MTRCVASPGNLVSGIALLPGDTLIVSNGGLATSATADSGATRSRRGYVSSRLRYDVRRHRSSSGASLDSEGSGKNQERDQQIGQRSGRDDRHAGKGGWAADGHCAAGQIAHFIPRRHRRLLQGDCPQQVSAQSEYRYVHLPLD